MSTLHITRGLPGSGKTTWARDWVELDVQRRAMVNRDRLRFTMYGHRRGDGSLSYAQEEAVTLAQQAAIRALLGRGIDVVADDMNLRPKYVRAWREFAQSEGHEFKVHSFGERIEVCIERDMGRPVAERVGEAVIRELAHKYTTITRNGTLFLDADPIERPEVTGAKYVPDASKPKAIIVDIDGTLAINNSGRGWYDLEEVANDDVNYPIAEMVHSLFISQSCFAPSHFVYCSGRQEGSREVTEKWLREKALPEGPLFMRADNDNRQDAIVKRELFDKHIRDNYNVLFVLDDRDQVVKMWRSLGLTCLQVADGNF